MLHGKWLIVICKSEKHYPVVMKDISHVKIVSLHVRCYWEYADHSLLIVPSGSKDNVKSPYEIFLIPVVVVVANDVANVGARVQFPHGDLYWLIQELYRNLNYAVISQLASESDFHSDYSSSRLDNRLKLYRC